VTWSTKATRTAVLPLLLCLAACSSSPPHTAIPSTETSTSAADANIGPQSAPTSPSSTARSILFDLSVASPKGYKARLHFESPLPVIQLGDPGMINVGGLKPTSATFSNETSGGRSILMGTDPTFDVRAAWPLPAELTQYVDLSSKECNGTVGDCDPSALYLVSSTPLKGDRGYYNLVHLEAGQPLILSTASMLAGPARISETGGSGLVPSVQFPEFASSAVGQLLRQPPAVVYVVIPQSRGSFGFADGISTLPCLVDPDPLATAFLLGVLDGTTGQELAWPAVQSVKGQPCNQPEVQAPPSG